MLPQRQHQRAWLHREGLHSTERCRAPDPASPPRSRCPIQAGESAAARALLAEDEGTAGAADGGGDNEGSPRGKKYRMTGKTGAFVYMAPEVSWENNGARDER